MREWIAAVRAGRPVSELIPVETSGGGAPLPATEETAAMLESRLDFIDERILSEFEADLAAD
jgi:hypothetical protein